MARFNPSSGLVYQETLTPVRSMVPKWTTDSRGRRVDPSKVQQPYCDSLQSMALRACVWNIHHMEPGALQWLGWWYASRLYSHLKSNDTLTFHAWNTFRKAYPEEVDRHATFRVQERDHESTQYPSVVDHLSRLDISWLTFLCVRISNLSIDHLVALTKIQTLAVLVLEDGTDSHHTMEKPPVETLRDWGRSVGESDTLKKLRVLVLSGYDIYQINTVFKSMSSFPALNLIGIDGLLIQSGVENCWGNWTNHIAQCPNAIKESPSSIWETSATTTASKMRRLYQFSLDSAPFENAKAAEIRSISMLYMQTRESVPRCHTEWFHRELQDGRDSKTKRPQNEDHRDCREIHSKKLKIRDRNKVAMDSLLGSFM